MSLYKDGSPFLNDSQPTAMKPNCETCKYYHSIDSGYGYCFGLPAAYEERPIVAWRDPVCAIWENRR